MFAEHMKRANPWEDHPFGNHHHPLHHPHTTSSAGTGTCSSEVAAPHMIPIRIVEDNYTHHSPNSSMRSNSPMSMQMQIPMSMSMEMPEMEIPLEFKQPISKIEIPNCFRQNDDIVRGGGGGGGQRILNIPPPLNMSNEIPQQQQSQHYQQSSNQHSPFIETSQSQQQNRIPSPINSPSHTSGGIRHIPIFLEGQNQQGGGVNVKAQSPVTQSQNQNSNQQTQQNHQSQTNNSNNSQEAQNTSNINLNNNNNNLNNNNNNTVESSTIKSQQQQQKQEPVPIPIPLPPPISIIDELKQQKIPPSPPPRSPKNMKPNYNQMHNSSDDLKSHRTFPFFSNSNNTNTNTNPNVNNNTSNSPTPTNININIINDGNISNSNGTNLSSMDESQANVPPPQKKPTPSKSVATTAIEKVQAISEDVKQLEKQVADFAGTTKTKEYLFLDEMLTRNLIKLDDIEVGGKEDVRMARKNCIKLINDCINNLEAKIANATNALVLANNNQNKNIVQKTSSTQQSVPSREQVGFGRGHQHHRSEVNFQVNGEEKKNSNSGGKIVASDGEVNK